ncbi:CHAT domain-containing protein [Streptomyces sp. NPDC049040]|uniref:CHAT domain-containing protein n=1 Tax=Streptomyces sp. NPDC049040 TaxID=3365593 RepID=UPI003711D339
MPLDDGKRRWGVGWVDAGGTVGQPFARPRSPRPMAMPPPPEAVVPEPASPPVERTALRSSPADPHRRLPHGMAKLLVQRTRDSEGNLAYLLTGSADDGTADGDAGLPYHAGPELPPTRITLARVRSNGALPSDYYRAVLDWSRRQRPLVRWLNELRALHGDALQLVVWDDTDFEIPWELLSLDGLEGDSEGEPDGGAGTPAAPAGPLGALVPVARWTTIREQAGPLLDGPAQCAGDVVGYFDAPMRSDAAAFQPFAHEPHADPETFLTSLNSSPRGADRSLGLVYMGYYGTHGKGLEDLTAGVLTWYELNEVEMSALAGGGTVVCLNACHSGRLVHNRDGGEDALRGFSELFLRNGATACIATRGEVPDTVASGLLTHLVAHAGRTPERPLAHMLRDYRARAAADLPDPVPRRLASDGTVDHEGQRRVLRFLHHFMYVYYGHPLTTLRLSPRVPEGAA